MRFTRQASLAACVASILTAAPVARAHTQSLKNLGMVGVVSTHGRYLQAHTDGELHASNEKRNEEETWFLVQVDASAHVYALQNWRTGKFMSKRGKSCAPAVATTLGRAEQWVVVSGKSYGIQNAVAFRSLADGTYLGAFGPGQDTSCGGEVAAGSPAAPPQNDGNWAGWWVLRSATKPSPGTDAWNTIGGVFSGVLANITPADVAALLAAVL